VLPARASDHTLAAEEDPFEKAVKLFALVCGRLDCRPQLLIGKILRERNSRWSHLVVVEREF
jgi:hypothetical protein